MKNFFYLAILPAISFLNFSCCKQAAPTTGSISINRYAENPAPKKKCSCEAGATIASINGDAESYDSPLIGGQLGFSYELGDGAIGFKPGINVAMAGSKYHDTYIDGSVRLIYLNVPLLADYTTPSGFFVEAGLQPGILLSAKDKYAGSSYNFKQYVNTFELGLPVGAGYFFKNGFGVGARVTPGILNLNKDESDGKVHNFVIAVRALYNFGGN